MIPKICENYFIATFRDAYHFQEKSALENLFTVGKIVSLATLVIPLGLAVLYGIDLIVNSLSGRVRPGFKTEQTDAAGQKAQEILGSGYQNKDLFALMKEISENPDTFSKLRCTNSQLLDIFGNKPQDEQKQIVGLASRDLEEIRQLATNGTIPNSAFENYGAYLVEILLIMPLEDQDKATTALHELYPLIYKFQIEELLRIKVSKKDRLRVLQEVQSLVASVEKSDKNVLTDVNTFISAYTVLHKKRLDWVVGPYLKFIQAKNTSDLKSIERLLEISELRESHQIPVPLILEKVTLKLMESGKQLDFVEIFKTIVGLTSSRRELTEDDVENITKRVLAQYEIHL